MPHAISCAPLRWLLLVLFIACSACDRFASSSPVIGSPLSQPQPKSELRLLDTNDEPFDFPARTRGKLTLMFFGYTHCPDVCPVTMANIGAALDKLGASDRSKVAVVFVSTDPDRDTPSRLREWLDEFGHDFIGLRGDSTALADAERAFGLPPSVSEKHAGGGHGGDHGGDQSGDAVNYKVGHSAVVLVFTPDDSLRMQYPFGTRHADWARDLPKLLRYPSQP